MTLAGQKRRKSVLNWYILKQRDKRRGKTKGERVREEEEEEEF